MANDTVFVALIEMSFTNRLCLTWRRSVGWCSVLTLLVLGCSARFPQSSVFQNLNVASLLLAHNHKPDTRIVSSSTTLSAEYAIQDCKAFVIVAAGGREEYLSRIFVECTNRVTELGGAIIGKGGTSSLDRQELIYKTDKTKGQINVYSTTINETNMEVLAIMFECRKR